MIRDVLLVVYAAAWLFAVVMTQVRTGTVPAELWAGLGIGTGAILAIFRTERYVNRRRTPNGTPPSDESRDSES